MYEPFTKTDRSDGRPLPYAHEGAIEDDEHEQDDDEIFFEDDDDYIIDGDDDDDDEDGEDMLLQDALEEMVAEPKHRTRLALN